MTWGQIKAISEDEEVKQMTRPFFFLPILNLLKEFPDVSVLHKLAMGKDQEAGSRIQPIS